MKNLFRSFAVALTALVVLSTSALAQTWQPVATTGPPAAGVPLLLTDGSVLVHNMDTSLWWKLTPDAFGDYVHGTWKQVASLPAGYGPLYYASAVLADGRVIVMGGEYNFGIPIWTNQGAIYDPVADTWTPLAAPLGWLQIGDAQCAVLPDGSFMMANPFDTRTAILDPVTLTWTTGATGKTDRNDEEGWTLLPDGSLLTLDAINAPNAERFIPSLNTWISAGASPLSLVQPTSQEIGPAVLRPDGTVFATGATGHNAIYIPGANLTDTGTWIAAPDFPIVAGLQLDIADGPACLLPSGNVLCGASPGVFQPNTRFFEFDGTSLLSVPATPNSPRNPSYVGNMLMLPSGQVLYTDFTSDVEIYTPTGSPNDAWRPTLSSAPTSVVPGQTYTLSGTQFNGLSQCSAYGDDANNATNYPLVRITNLTTGHVFYCQTFGHSTMGVATGSTPTSTNFTTPLDIEAGISTLEVVTNGIASFPVFLGANTNMSIIQRLIPSSVEANRGDLALTVNGIQFQDGDTLTWTIGGVSTSLPTAFVSANQLTTTIPAAFTSSVGTASVQVVRSDGTTSNPVLFTITTDVPAISSLAPSSVEASTGAFTLTVNGLRFRSGDTVTWNAGGVSTPLATTFNSGSSLNVTVTADLIFNQGTATITVNRANGEVSNGALFTITTDAPILSTVTPSTIPAFGPDFTVTVSGARFRSQDVVRWSLNGVLTPLVTTFVNISTLTATVPAALIADSGIAQLTVIDQKGQISNPGTVTLTNPVPLVLSINPAAVSAGSPDFTLTVTGDHFVRGAVVQWGLGNAKTPLATTYVSTTQLTAVVPAALVAAPGKASIGVSNPSPGGGGSVAEIGITIGGAVVLKSFTPSTVSAGLPFTMTLKGSGFLAGAVVRIGNVSVVGTVSSDTLMTANVPGSAVPVAGTTTVKVVNPGGASTAVFTLTIQNPLPVITSISPSVVTAGGPSFLLTVSGSSFVPGAVVQWNGKAVSTTYVSGNQLTAAIPVTSIVKKGTFQITVNNPKPGGGNSNSVVLTAN